MVLHLYNTVNAFFSILTIILMHQIRYMYILETYGIYHKRQYKRKQADLIIHFQLILYSFMKHQQDLRAKNIKYSSLN